LAMSWCSADSRRFASARFDCSSDWAQVPDTVLLQAIIALGPGDVCSIAKCCNTWAETVTSSETWLWSVVGMSGLPNQVMQQLTQWASSVRLGLRSALQLWMCRAHLWGGAQWAFDEAHDPVASVTCQHMPCETAVVCAAAWPGGGGEDRPGIAVGFASGILAFGSLALGVAPAHGLQGLRIAGVGEGLVAVRAAHGNQLMSAIKPLGARAEDGLVSAGLDGLLRIWDPHSGQETLQIITEHARGINDVAVCPGDGKSKQVLSCGDDGNALLYQLGENLGSRPLRILQGHTAAAYCVSWLSSSTCVTGGFDRKVLLWDSRSPRALVQTMQLRQHAYAVARLGGTGADASTTLAVGLADGTLSLWDTRRISKEPLREMRGHAGSVECLATLPGDILASASSDGSLRLWDCARRSGETSAWTWTSPGPGPLTSVVPLFEDTLLVGGAGARPTLLSLDYSIAVPHVPEVLDRMQIPSLQPWRRGMNPSEGFGRHSAMVSQRRLQRSRTRDEGASSCGGTSKGAFDRTSKGRPMPQGATGIAHRTFLFGRR